MEKVLDPVATAQELVNRFKDFKPIPHIAMRICELTSKEECTNKEIEELIRLDPTLVSRLLRIVNSPYYRLCTRVDSISRAITFIGLKNLRNLVVSDAVKGLIQNEKEGEVLSARTLLLHCTAVGVCAQMLSRRVFGNSGEDAFLAGILHDIGMVVELQVQEEPFNTAVREYMAGSGHIIDYEREAMGTDHCSVGGLLATEWRFPDEVQKVIRHHHAVIENDKNVESLMGIFQTADYIASVSGYNAIPDKMEEPEGAIARNIKANAAEYQVLAREFLDEMQKIEVFFTED